MHPRLILRIALTALVAGVWSGSRSGSLAAEEPAASLRVTFRNPRGNDLGGRDGLFSPGPRIRLEDEAGQVFYVRSYSPWLSEAVELPAGSYDLLCPSGTFAGERCSTLRRFGVRVQPGANQLDLIGQPGDSLVREGRPRASASVRTNTGRLEGQVTTRKGEPVQGKRFEPVGVQLVLRAKGQIIYLRPTQLDAGGFYEARDLPPGHYQLQIGEAFYADERFPPRTIKDFEIKAGEVVVQDLQITREKVISGPVTRLPLSERE